MKYLSFILCILLTIPAMAFNVGPSSRANFGTSQQEDPAKEQKGPVTRTATTYSSRWGKGVQTNTVQTTTATALAEQSDEKIPPATAATPQVSVKKGSATVVSKPAAAAKTESSATASGKEPPQQAASAEQQGQSADVAAAMAQLGQLQGMMNSLQGLSGGQGSGSNTGNSSMPAGMPDLSALMGAQQPAKK